MIGPHLSRRHVLALGLACLPVGACAAQMPPPAPPPEVPIRLHTSWNSRPDGPLPDRGDEGVPITLAQIATAGVPTVTSGALVGNLSDQHAAAYVMQQPPGALRRIGAVFGVDPGSTAGSLGVIFWTSTERFSGPLHLAIGSERWIASTAENESLTEIGSGALSTPLPLDGRPSRVEVVLDGDTMAITLPDGSVVRPHGTDVARLPAAVACWEFYRDAPGGSAVRLYETWAG
jgi:hypothetical protein